MKYSYKPIYTFNPAAGTINFQAQPGFDFHNLFSIINVTTGNAAIYMVGIGGYGASIDATGTILTLQQSTSIMNSTDTLVMVYDEGKEVLSELLYFATDKRDDEHPLEVLPKGLYIRQPKMDGLALTIWAESRLTNILLQKLIGDNENLDTQLAEIINTNS